MMDATSSKLEVTPAFENEFDWMTSRGLTYVALHFWLPRDMDWDQLAGKQHCWAQPGKPGVCKKLNINQQCDLAANTVSSFLDCINSTPRRLRDSASIRAHLHLPLHTSGIRTIELNGENSALSCQNAQGVEEFVLEQDLGELGLFGLATGVSGGNLVAAWPWLWGGSKKDGARLSWWCGVRMRGNALEVKLEVWAEEKERFFLMRAIKQWKRYQKRWDASFFEIFWTQLDETLSNVIWPHSESSFE